MQRVIWWTVFIVFMLIIFLGVYALSLSVITSPETASFVLGLLGFWLFANRLVFGFGGIVNTAKAFLDGREISKDFLGSKIIKDASERKVRGVENLTVAALFSLWKESLEPYKYTYYFAFFLILVLSLLFELNLISLVSLGPVIEAFTFGAAIPTLIVWGLELLAGHYLCKVFQKASESGLSQN